MFCDMSLIWFFKVLVNGTHARIAASTPQPQKMMLSQQMQQQGQIAITSQRGVDASQSVKVISQLPSTPNQRTTFVTPQQLATLKVQQQQQQILQSKQQPHQQQLLLIPKNQLAQSSSTLSSNDRMVEPTPVVSNNNVAMAPGSRPHTATNAGVRNKVMMLPPYLIQNSANLNGQQVSSVSASDRQKILESLNVNNNHHISTISGATSGDLVPASVNCSKSFLDASAQGGCEGVSDLGDPETLFTDDLSQPSLSNSMTYEQQPEVVNNNPSVFNAYISLRNVVASFQVKCYLTLRKIALSAINVEYKRETGVSNSFGVNCVVLVLLPAFLLDRLIFFKL